MKANGIHQSQSDVTTASSIRGTPIPSPRRKTSPSIGPSNKKRKLDNLAETTSNVNTDDDEGLSNLKAESSTTVKTEPIKVEPVKQECTEEEGTPEATANTEAAQCPSSGAMGFDGAVDDGLFDDFLAFGGTAIPAAGNGDGQGPHESIVIMD